MIKIVTVKPLIEDEVTDAIFNIINSTSDKYPKGRIVIGKMCKLLNIHSQIHPDAKCVWDYWMLNVFIPYYKYVHSDAMTNAMDDIVIWMSKHQSYESILKHSWNIILITRSKLVAHIQEIQQYDHSIHSFQDMTSDFCEKFQ